MLDPELIRTNPESVKLGVKAKGYDPAIVDEFLSVDRDYRNLLREVELLRAEAKKIAKAKNIEEGKKLKLELEKLENKLRTLEEKRTSNLLSIPNLPLPDVKLGQSEEDNEIIKVVKTPRKFSFQPKDHLELGMLTKTIDTERAGKVSGSRFGYLLREGVLLEFGLVMLAMEVTREYGFIPVIPPVLIKTEMMKGMGYWEHGGSSEMYVLERDNLVLVGTSEQSIGPMHQGEVFKKEDLPKRYLGFSSCFRREAGSYGKDTRGIFRVHQFDKVEMFSFAEPSNADREHELILSIEEKLFGMLEIPYRVVKMCTADLGFPTARKYDLEAFIPSQNRYREVTSASTTTDFQARRLGIKFRDESGKAQYLHMLNGTAFAIGRTIIAIYENYQNQDGSITVPEVLRKYVGFEVIPKRE